MTNYLEFVPSWPDDVPDRIPDPRLPDRLESVAVVVPQNCAPFELGVLCEVFGTDRSEAGLPVYDFAVCSSRTEPIRTRCGFTLQVEHGLDRVATADLVAIPAYHGDQPDASFAGHRRRADPGRAGRGAGRP